MEIERKYLVKTLPENLENYECKQIAQGYLCTSPPLQRHVLSHLQRRRPYGPGRI